MIRSCGRCVDVAACSCVGIAGKGIKSLVAQGHLNSLARSSEARCCIACHAHQVMTHIESSEGCHTTDQADSLRLPSRAPQTKQRLSRGSSSQSLSKTSCQPSKVSDLMDSSVRWAASATAPGASWPVRCVSDTRLVSVSDTRVTSASPKRVMKRAPSQ
jgi:hypothetical protein